MAEEGNHFLQVNIATQQLQLRKITHIEGLLGWMWIVVGFISVSYLQTKLSHLGHSRGCSTKKMPMQDMIMGEILSASKYGKFAIGYSDHSD